MSGRLQHLIIAYDVETVTKAGKRRLRRVADLCCAHGTRVQYSVFECALEVPDLVRFIDRLRREVDGDADSLRIYHLGSAMPAVEVHGRRVLTTRDPVII